MVDIVPHSDRHIARGKRSRIKSGRFLGPPPCIGGQNVVTIPRGKTKVTFTLYADGNARFLKDNDRPFPNLPPIAMVFVGFPGDDPVASTAPIQEVGSKGTGGLTARSPNFVGKERY